MEGSIIQLTTKSFSEMERLEVRRVDYLIL